MEKTIKRLNHMTADLVVLAQKVRQCHWNVEGPGFLDYHEFFEELYKFLIGEIDDFAERVRAFDEYPVGTYAEMIEIASIKERKSIPSGEMVTELLSDLEHLSKELRTWIEDEKDAISEDMFIGIITELEKKAWMLRSMKKTGVHG